MGERAPGFRIAPEAYDAWEFVDFPRTIEETVAAVFALPPMQRQEAPVVPFAGSHRRSIRAIVFGLQVRIIGTLDDAGGWLEVIAVLPGCR